MHRLLSTLLASLSLSLAGCASGVEAEADGGMGALGMAPPVLGESACALDCPVCNDWAMKIESCTMQWLPAERADFTSRCTYSARNWSGTFGVQFSGCITMVDCLNLDNGDDICFPAALQTLGGGTLDPNLSASCFSGDSQACRAAVSSTVAGPDLVSSCLQKWSMCSADLSVPQGQFSQNHCLSTIGLTPSAQANVQQCLLQDCASIVQCLDMAGAFAW